jgi:hypothetical protein
MFVNFGLAKETGGGCYLRFDDTNPEAEKQEYIDHIQSIVSWMGWKPFKITYSSDYFQDLYELAVELIKRGRAYVDHQVWHIFLRTRLCSFLQHCRHCVLILQDSFVASLNCRQLMKLSYIGQKKRTVLGGIDQ